MALKVCAKGLAVMVGFLCALEPTVIQYLVFAHTEKSCNIRFISMLSNTVLQARILPVSLVAAVVTLQAIHSYSVRPLRVFSSTFLAALALYLFCYFRMRPRRWFRNTYRAWEIAGCYVGFLACVRSSRFDGVSSINVLLIAVFYIMEGLSGRAAKFLTAKAIIISVLAFIGASPQFYDKSDLVLCLGQLLFASLAYRNLERIFEHEPGFGGTRDLPGYGNSSSARGGVESADLIYLANVGPHDELHSGEPRYDTTDENDSARNPGKLPMAGWGAFGQDFAFLLLSGCAAFALLFENVLGTLFSWQADSPDADFLRNGNARQRLEILGGAVLQVLTWAFIPWLYHRYHAAGLTLIRVLSVLAIRILSPPPMSFIQTLALSVALVGIIWWLIDEWHLLATFIERERLKSIWAWPIISSLLVASGVFAVSHRSCRQLPLQNVVSEPSLWAQPALNQHPIPRLMQEASERYIQTLQKQSKSLEEAVSEYKRRYRMNPPPHFDHWYKFAKDRGIVLIDEFDTIYDSLKPFWAVEPRVLRKRVDEAIGFSAPIGQTDNALLHISVRGGIVESKGQGNDWIRSATRKMIEPFSAWLPDMNLAFNVFDEPRIILPYATLRNHLDKADAVSAGHPASGPVNSFMRQQVKTPKNPSKTEFNNFAHQQVWHHAVLSCPPDSPVRALAEQTQDSREKYALGYTNFLFNVTAHSDVCLSPSFRLRHGLFQRPNAFSVALRLHPIFSQSKISSFNDILYPSPWYWAERTRYKDSEDIGWDQKQDRLYWRGSTTGGFSRNGDWISQHRQRVVSRLEGKSVSEILQHTVRGNWTKGLAQWERFDQYFDVHFSRVEQCDTADCDAQKAYFRVVQRDEQNVAWRYKYLLDMDGNAFSGRYHAFLKSRSTVFKMAIFREALDDWLFPWVHYVPVHLGAPEVVEAVRYFREEPEGDVLAKKIADQGRNWAMKALRKEDLEAWMFRLLLEYARVIDDRRETIGYSRA